MPPARTESVQDARGCSLLEVLVATTIVVTGVVALAQLFALATHANLRARQTTFAAVLAQQKLEQLRSLAWSVDAFGLPVSDLTTDTTVVPEAVGGGTGLTPSPAGALGSTVEGYSDFVDRRGNVLGGGPTPPAGSAYLRRWSIEPLPTSANNTLILQVLVTDLRNRGAADTTTAVTRLPDEARIVGAKTRKAF
jgi:type II secretory pathway pseudopilin PulG